MEIDTVVFDVGKVLFHFSFEPFFTFLADHGFDGHGPSVLIRADQRAHEHGDVTGEEFLSRIEAELPRKPNRAALLAAWADIFTPIEDMHELLRTLRGRYRTFLLSNTSALHWAALNDRFAIDALTDGIVTSYTVGIMKPDPRIYELAEQRHAILPHQTVFIDDIQENVEAAQARGWAGIVHIDTATTLNSLRALGITPPKG